MVVLVLVVGAPACGDSTGSGGDGGGGHAPSGGGSVGGGGAGGEAPGGGGQGGMATGGGGATSGGGGTGGIGEGGGGAPAQGDVVLNEITSDSASDDKIELFNRGLTAVDLSGYSVVDDAAHEYVFPDGSSIEAGTYLVLVGGTDHMFGVGNDDSIELRDASGNSLDLADWGPDEAIVSYCRVPNGTGPFQTCATQSFGAPNP